MNMWCKNIFYSLMAHVWELQMVVSVEFPIHRIPPLAGEGLLQVLDRVWMPPPQVFEQDEKNDHSLHLPSNFILFEIFMENLFCFKIWTNYLLKRKFYNNLYCMPWCYSSMSQWNSQNMQALHLKAQDWYRFLNEFESQLHM